MFNSEELNHFFRYCCSLTGNEDQAYDLLHSSVERWLRLRPNQVEKRNAYFIRMIRNLFIDQKRKKANSETPTEQSELNQMASDNNVVSMETSSIEKMLITKEEVDSLMKHLDSEQRELLFLWAVEEYTIDEISKIIETPRGTLLSRLHRIRKFFEKKEAQNVRPV